MSDDELRGIFPRKWTPEEWPSYEYAEYIDTRLRQVGCYSPGTFEDVVFCYDDNRHEHRVYIKFADGIILMKQVAWKLPPAPIYGIRPLPDWLK